MRAYGIHLLENGQTCGCSSEIIMSLIHREEMLLKMCVKTLIFKLPAVQHLCC